MRSRVLKRRPPALQAVPELQQAALAAVGSVEEAMVGAFPFEVPAEYSNLPQLKVLFVVSKDLPIIFVVVLGAMVINVSFVMRL